MLRDRLRDLEIKISELADYLQLSRPTMYKFIELYDNGSYKQINSKVLGLFKYIEKNTLIGKRNVIGYILENISTINNTDDVKINKMLSEIKEYVINNLESEKTQFIRECIKTSKFDIHIHYLLEISSIIKNKNYTEEQKEKLRPFQEILDIYINLNVINKSGGEYG